MKNKNTLSVLTAVAAFAGATHGQLVVESFNYPDGSLVGALNSPWITSGGTSGQVQVSSGAITINDSDTEDVAIGFGSQTSGELFASFEFSVADPVSYTGVDFEYFAHFRNDASAFISRIDLAAFSASGFRVGISSNTSEAQSVWATDLAYGTTYTAVLSYSFETGSSTLWIDPVDRNSVNIVGTSLSVGELDAFVFRQSGATPDQSITLDNLTIDTAFPVAAVPEPSTYAALAGLCGIAFACIRRRLRA
ncbi:MAG: PEP-CTERM sorting domain-containing protein [Verrucomicrobiota bacterium JB022]|nr:PEP-CTERM sorting domain-containing protein [Verrucomicrobiota bacterium JB022]